MFCSSVVNDVSLRTPTGGRSPLDGDEACGRRFFGHLSPQVPSLETPTFPETPDGTTPTTFGKNYVTPTLWAFTECQHEQVILLVHILLQTKFGVKRLRPDRIQEGILGGLTEEGESFSD